MTPRAAFVGLVALGLAIATSAFAGWGPNGAVVEATTNNIPTPQARPGTP